MTTIVLVRHGRTAWNASGRFQGQADPALDHLGGLQSEAVAAGVAACRPDLVIASDLRRARQTGATIARRCRVPLVTTPALREVDLGSWSGLTEGEAAARFPEEHAAFAADPADPTLRRGGGETLAEAGRRVAAALLAIAAASPPEAVLVIVSHGRALQSALAQLGVAEPPHLANGAFATITIDSHGTRSELTGSTQAPG